MEQLPPQSHAPGILAGQLWQWFERLVQRFGDSATAQQQRQDQAQKSCWQIHGALPHKAVFMPRCPGFRTQFSSRASLSLILGFVGGHDRSSY